MKQQEIWDKYTDSININDIIVSYQNPKPWQKELANLINSLCEKNNYKKVIEIGCETGITNMLLNDRLEKYFLDFNEKVLEKVKEACMKLNIKGKFIVEDMFSMNCPNGYYDVVFNSGVIEHYNKEDRIEILKEYKRVLKKDGMIILAIPNHYSLPYRSAYLFHTEILFGLKWPYPKEYKIYNLKEEIDATNMKLVTRTTLGKETIFNFWNFFKPIKKLFLWSDPLFKYEEYLTTLIIQNKNN